MEGDFDDGVYLAMMGYVYVGMRRLNIFSSKVRYYVQLMGFFMGVEQMKSLFFSQPSYPWIPGSVGYNIDSVKGMNLEIRSALGPFLRISLLPYLELDQNDVENN